MLSTWIMVLLLCVTAVLDVGPLIAVNDDVNAVLTVLVGFTFIVLHGLRALGTRLIVAFIAITVLLSFTSEAVGVATGLVFGSYYYTDLIGPKILGVPPLIQAGYVAMDPFQSTAAGEWIWRDGGEYFGVGLHNYAGWFGTVFAFMLLYGLYEMRNPAKPPAAREQTGAGFWSLPALYYGLVGFGIVDTSIVEGSHLNFVTKNYAGTALTMETSLALVAMFVMGGPVVFALCRLFAGGGAREALETG